MHAEGHEDDWPEIDLGQAFDGDYLHFYGHFEEPELVASEAALVEELLERASGRSLVGARVLDLGCGTGRIAVALAEQGVSVTGLDQSEAFLEVARARTAEAGLEGGNRVEWRCQDYRQLEDENVFDAVVCWFTSFGYFDDTTDRDVLSRIQRALVPGGKLLLDAASLMQVAGASDQSEVHRRADELLVDQVLYDPISGRRITDRTVWRQGHAPRSFRFPLRIFTPTELRSWIEGAGLTDVEFFDEFGEAFHLDAERMIVTACKPTSP